MELKLSMLNTKMKKSLEMKSDPHFKGKFRLLKAFFIITQFSYEILTVTVCANEICIMNRAVS